MDEAVSSGVRSLAADDVPQDEGQRFIKRDTAAAEAVEKYNWLYEIAASNDFVAPHAELVARHGSQAVSLEFIPNFIPLRQLFVRYLLRMRMKPSFLSLMREIGRALAAIHNATIPDRWVRHHIETDFHETARRYGLSQIPNSKPVPLHGDFGQMNIGIARDSGAVVVLDPCGNTEALVGHHLAYGDPELDVSLMLGFLEGQINSPAILLATHSRICKAQAAFLEGYLGGGRKIDLESAFAYSNAFFCFRMRKLGPLRRLSTRMLYNNIRGNSTVQDKVACIQRYLNV